MKNLNTTQQKAKQDLLNSYIKPKTQLIINITKVAINGMSRRMKVYVIEKDNLIEITSYIADLLDGKENRNGLNIQGCGMDMTFWLANMVTSHLWGDKKPKALTGNGGDCLEWKVL